MSKVVDLNSMDAGLNDIKSNGNIMHLCSSQPSQYSDIAGLTLGNVSLASGDYTLQNGAVSGRRLTVAQKTVVGSGAGTAAYVVIADTGNSRIKCITTCPSYTMANSVPVVVASYDCWEIENPT